MCAAKKYKKYGDVRSKTSNSAIKCGFLITTMAYFSMFHAYLMGILISFNVLDCHYVIMMDEMM